MNMTDTLNHLGQTHSELSESHIPQNSVLPGTFISYFLQKGNSSIEIDYLTSFCKVNDEKIVLS